MHEDGKTMVARGKTDRAARRTIATGSGLALALALASPAIAQEAEQDSLSDTVTASDIVVTARRVEERLQDVPISITVFNQQQLTNRNVVNAQDLANYTPSLSASSNFGSDNTSFALRGFVQDIGTPPSVGVYFADVVAPRASSNGIQSGDGAGPGSFFDLQNVQVLKGPQGTLFGRNTTGGAILFVPQKPTSRLEGYVEGSVGNYDLRRAQGVINVPLADTFRVRLAVDRNKRGGYLNNKSGIGPKRFGDVDYLAARLSIVADLTPDLENYTIASFLDSDNNGTIQRSIACDPNGTFGALACGQLAAAQARGDGFYDVENVVEKPFSRIKQWQVINTTTWKASDSLTIKNIVSYSELRNNLRQTYGGTAWRVGPGQPVSFSVIMAPAGSDLASQSTFTEELQLQGGSSDQRLIWQAGVYYEQSDPLGNSALASPVLLSCAGGVSDGLNCTDLLGIGASQSFGVPVNIGNISGANLQSSFRNIGTYAQASYGLTDQLKLTGGIRYTWDKQTATNERYGYIFPVVPPFTGGATRICTDAETIPTNCVARLRQSSKKPTWVVGLDYKPDDDLLLYAKYSRGYRAGGVFPNAPSNYRTFEPEKVDAYEAGAKLSFSGPVRGYFNVAGFYNDFADQQIFVGFSAAPGKAGQPTTGIVNAGKSRIYGAEVEASVTPFDGFTLDASYTYLNATIREIDALVSLDPNYVVSAQILPGNPLLLSPKHKFSATASYTLPLDESLGRITLASTVSFTDKQLTAYDFNDPALLAVYGSNLTRLDSRTLVNLNLSWNSVAGSPVDLGLFATNVTKKKYYTYVPSFSTLGFFPGTIGEPRMYGLRLRYNFGE